MVSNMQILCQVVVLVHACLFHLFAERYVERFSMQSDEMEPLPGTTETHEVIANALAELSPVPGASFGTFMADLHKLYFDENKAKFYKDYVGQHVHFHNWDHARNIWKFAQWFTEQKIEQKDVKTLEKEEQFFLTLAAISHDVMHPGTKNDQQMVEASFLPNVNAWSKKSWTLEEYAKDLLEMTGVESSQLRSIMGCDFGPAEKACGNDVETLMTRAPQELLHAWITATLLAKHVGPFFQNPTNLVKVVIPILMTSINIHFMVLFHGGAPTPDNIKKWVNDEPKESPYNLGLLLHLFDMGYICETGILSTDVGVTFAARYLVESNNSGNGFGSTFEGVQKGQDFFADMAVMPYLQALRQTKVMGERTFEQLSDGVAAFKADSHGLKKALEFEVKEARKKNTQAAQALGDIAWLQ